MFNPVRTVQRSSDNALETFQIRPNEKFIGAIRMHTNKDFTHNNAVKDIDIRLLLESTK